MHARERLYLTADKGRLVRHGDPKAAFLYAVEGDEIPASAAEKFGLVEGRLKAKGKPKVTIVEKLTHLDVPWSIVEIEGSFFARTGDDQDTGPYSSADEAREWVLAIVPATPKPEKPETTPTPKPEEPPAKKPAAKATAKKAAPRKR